MSASQRRSMSKSPVTADATSLQKQPSYRRPYSEPLNHHDGDGNDHYDETAGFTTTANVLVGGRRGSGSADPLHSNGSLDNRHPDHDNDDEADGGSTIAGVSSKWDQFYDDHCTYLPAMAGWFVFSACLSAYNKVVFGTGHMAFPCPLLLTTMHFGYQWMFASLLGRFYPDVFCTDRVSNMSWGEYLMVALPCGLVTSGDVGLSNLSLVTISITFYTMVKASTPIFVLAWAYVFGIERITCNLLIVVAIIAAGEFLTVMGEVEFELHGFFLCLSASVMSGARWTLVQLKLQTMDPPLKTTVATMKMLAPSMFFTMLTLSLVFERPWNKFESMYAKDALDILWLGTLGASFAIAMILCEFYLIMYSSAVILMIGGVLKEMFTIVLGVTMFHDQLNRVNVAGCFVVFAGILFYKVTFHSDKHKNGPAHAEPPERQYRAVGGSEDDLEAHGGVDVGLANRGLSNLDSPKGQSLPAVLQSKMELQHVELRPRSGPLSQSVPPSPIGSPKGRLV